MAINQNRKGSREHSTPATGGQISPPTITLPKGGGAIRGIGEKFAANPVTGTGSMTVPIATSPGRSGFGPQLSLSYDSGSGNGPFGFGWSLSLPSITRKTDKGLPRYWDAEESDVFILSGAEDLVPVLVKKNGQWEREKLPSRTMDGKKYDIQRYRPRIEGVFARIERWTSQADPADTYWRSISKDNITTWYGKTENSRIVDPDPDQSTHIFSWLICQSYDDKGNAIVYVYEPENSKGIDLSQAHEKNRTEQSRSANRYLKRIKYGNLKPNRDAGWNATDPSQLAEWMFEVVFDYGEGHYEEIPLDPSKTETEQHRYVLAPKDGQKDNTGQPLWAARQDPFSAYRAGFEVRTYRLCHRALMFHHFPQELGIAHCLVRSTEFTYDESPVASFITSVTQLGYVRQPDGNHQDRYLKKSLPPLEFGYSQVPTSDELARLPIREIDAESLENLPVGLDGTTYQWVDLDGEGISGILTEQADGWYYKRNLSPNNQVRENDIERTEVRFGPVELVASKPAASLAVGHAQFMDLAGDGQLDLVQMEGPIRGFYERTDDADWESFRPFTSWPNIDTRDPSLKFIDLNGDGHADIIVTEDDVLTWYPSFAEEGFGQALHVPKPLDEEKGPRLIFADGTQSIYLADLSGDGLTDLVRIGKQCGGFEVCYWPNLGYCRFGAKVTMDNPPQFDHSDIFNPNRIRLADIDGSGTTDIIYLHGDGVHIYFNQSGNSWSQRVVLQQFPPSDNISSVHALDLLGNGTACLVWSSPLPGAAGRPMRYIDLMGGQKPHLLVKTVNNLGAETLVQYSPSTKFYLDDKLKGTPWVTRLPFPVHVVERVETYDRISRNRFVTRYAYHHGYFDGIEREFRGFGMVEQWDTEEFAALSQSDAFPAGDNIDKSSYVPPVLTKTWFHTGAYFEGGRISKHFEEEYYREGDPSLGVQGLTDAQLEAMTLPDTILPDTVFLSDCSRVPFAPSADEEREACRALKGSILRQEIYALNCRPDGSLTEESDRPYTISERNYAIEAVQPQGENRHSVFFVHPRETIDFHYERMLYDVGGKKLADPRVTHSMTLEVDSYGNVLKSAAIGYGRRIDDPDPVLTDKDRNEQKRILITYTENDFTNGVLADDAYRTPLPAEARTYEILKTKPDSNQPGVSNLFRFDELAGKLLAASDGNHEIPYEDIEASQAIDNQPWRRLIERLRTLYRKNNIAGLLPLKQLESMALAGESYKLAFTPGLLAMTFRRKRPDGSWDDLLPYPDAVLGQKEGEGGGYVDLEGNNNWWIPSGRIFYSPNIDDNAAVGLVYAAQHFFLPYRYRDPFHTDLFRTETTVSYDFYDLLVLETRDAMGNCVTAGERDQAGALTIQGNDYRVLQPKQVMDPNRDRTEVAFDALGMVAGTAVMGKPEESLGDSLAGFIPDLTQDEIGQFFADPKGPVAKALLGNATTRIVYDITCYQREQDPQKKPPIFAATLVRETHVNDPLPAGGLKIQVSFSYSDGFGREIQKKTQAEKGPIVDGGPDIDPRWVGSGWTIFNNKGKPVRQYEPFFDDTHDFKFGAKVGVSPVLFYDPVERVIVTLYPNNTFEKVVFDPWHQKTYGVNDTVLLDPRSDPDVSGYTAAYFASQPAGWKTWLQQRISDPQNPPADSHGQAPERDAAVRALAHANTPTVAYFDSLGRTFLTVANNGVDQNGLPQKYSTRVKIDIENNQREVVDAKGRVVMRYDYDMLSNSAHQASMEAGERWTLNDVAGKPLYAWDSRGHQVRIVYDKLRRPIESRLNDGAGPELLVGRTVYGEAQSNPEDKNLRGKVVQVFDQAGVVTSDEYDFKGNLKSSSRQLATEYKTTLNWSTAVDLEPDIYKSSTTYDALNRPLTLTTPDKSVVRPSYNEANLLEQIEANLRGSSTATQFITNIDYNAKGQRTLVEYKNGVQTEYEYDALTFRLAHLLTKRDAAKFRDDCPNPPKSGWPGCNVQNLRYTYDPAGNSTSIRDDAQQTIYFDNKRVEPSGDYVYDAIYRLIEARGREHLGQTNGQPNPPTPPDAFNSFHTHPVDPRDGNAMGTYLEKYVYDAVGNFLSMQHRGSNPLNPGWTRTYAYGEASQLEPGKRSNRLSSTKIGQTTENYRYDGSEGLHGNITFMSHLPLMRWDYKDQLQATSQQVVNDGSIPETTHYVYDANGQRVRKITESSLTADQVSAGLKPLRLKERTYLGGYEIY